MTKYLPEFQEFIRSRRLADEKEISFLAYWAGKLLYFADRCGKTLDRISLAEYTAWLKKDPKVTDWQVQQAENAVKLYVLFEESKKKSTTSAPSIDSTTGPENHSEKTGGTRISERLREAMRLRHYSYRTETTYIEWARRFYAWMKSAKKDIHSPASEDVREFLTGLAVEARVSASTQNQAFNALLFLFTHVLHIPLDNLKQTVRAKRGVRIPVVLSPEEVQRIFQNAGGENLLIIKLLYGSGLRLMELARLRVQDIDFDNKSIYVRSGKGDKDRTTVLPESIREQLHQHLEKVKTLHESDLARGLGQVYLPEALARKYPHAAGEWRWQYVFPSTRLSVDPRSGAVRRHHLFEKSIQNIVARAVTKAGIAKHATVHTLRHSFATHLLMNGVNIREIQELLGHKNVETTMVYTHVMRAMSNAPKSPLDMLS